MARTACIYWGGSEFRHSGQVAQKELERRGYKVLVTQDLGSESRLSVIRIPPTGCDVSFWFTHGGWDGPMVFDTDATADTDYADQLDPVLTPAEWKQFQGIIARIMKPRGMMGVMACHSAGSNKYESTTGDQADRWVQQVARDMKVYTTGVQGSTASANHKWALDFVKYTLDGGSFPRQPAQAYAPGGLLQRPWTGWKPLN
jgi:hypothetical protein